jgi:2-methylcitrate dehydratase PrpD
MREGQITQALADWACRKTWDSAAPGQRASVIDSIVDTVGVALAGSVEPVSVLLGDYAVANGAPGTADIWGRPGRGLAAAAAAFANGAAAMSQEFDDRHVRYGHPSCVLVPALVAVAQSDHLDGRRVLEGYLAGVGIFAAVGCLYGAHREPRLEQRGWHITSVLGTAAAAAAVARALGLDHDQMASAIGIAVSMSSGISANVTSPVKAVHAGRAAHGGTDAALLARAGLTSAAGALEGEHGAMTAFGHHPGREVITNAADLDGLITIADEAPSGLIRKRFPAFGATHLAIEAALEVRQQLPPCAELASVRVQLPRARGGSAVSFRGEPRTPSEARHSFPYVVALALARGFLLPSFFTDGELFDERTRRVWETLSVDEAESDPAAEGNYAKVTAQTRDGWTFSAVRVFPPRMMSGEVTDAKFRSCAGQVMDDPAARVLLEQLRGLGGLEQLDRLFREAR